MIKCIEDVWVCTMKVLYKFHIICFYLTYGLYQGVITAPRMVASEALPNLLLLLITQR